ncbi:hypothetical protein NE237_024604 [Protea cynaroides]|uniref:AAA+ ATPase domain-containing protein n=1 Tax=Protea cynaroides TaxID=273540 RepID=A0A9Q0H0W4_9MAGN|nr:hypothetical protein NE237_024604 [Protea cynaroides]
MDILGPFVNIIAKYLIAPLVRRINYSRNFRDNVNALQTSIRNLTSRKNDEESKLQAAENDGQVQTHAARNWFNAVSEIVREADEIQGEYNQGTCAQGWSVNCWSRYKVSKRSIKLKTKADLRLMEQLSVARPPSPKPVIETGNEPIQNQSSTQQNLQQLIDCIKNRPHGIIGVYGMGGVGKTTLVGELNDRFKENSIFDTVIMVTVSATPNIKDIRTRISERLGLDLSNTSEDGAREKLLNALRKKKFLLILDDVWHQLELKNVGIPHPTRSHEGSKIILTTRNQYVCMDMKAEFTMKVKPLSGDEAWTFFVENVRSDVIANDRCGGLPLAIVTVARAMANHDGVGKWANAEREMRESIQDIRGMEEKVLTLLKFSFDRLDNDMLRSLFLYCARFPEDHNIIKDEILYFCVGEGLVDRLNSLTAAGYKGEDLIGSLKAACMLEDGEDVEDGSVRMHVMMRGLALWITSPESDSSSKFLIRTGGPEKEFIAGKILEVPSTGGVIVEAPKANEWVGTTRISLMKIGIGELPELGERCQNLATLLVRNCCRIHTIPPTNFFQHMDHLSVLDLCRTYKLKFLPDSLSCLVNLRVLRLQYCFELLGLPALGKLRQLQVLDLHKCEKLEYQILRSEWMEGICKLTYLDVSGSLVSFEAGIISSLHKLEELRTKGARMMNSRVSSENENNEGAGIDVRELYHLTQLTSLHISFKNMVISDWFKPLVEKTVELMLNCCTVVKDVIDALDKSQNPLKRLTIEHESLGLPYLPTRVEELFINECDDMEVVFDGVATPDCDSFSRLKKLVLQFLPKLKRICVDPAPQNCFHQLSHIHISGCNRLKAVFTKGMSGAFNNLKKIDIGGCYMMEVIIEVEEEGSHISRKICFPKLESLRLVFLPTLTDMCSNCVVDYPRLRESIVLECPRLKKDLLHKLVTFHQGINAKVFE